MQKNTLLQPWRFARIAAFGSLSLALAACGSGQGVTSESMSTGNGDPSTTAPAAADESAALDPDAIEPWDESLEMAEDEDPADPYAPSDEVAESDTVEQDVAAEAREGSVRLDPEVAALDEQFAAADTNGGQALAPEMSAEEAAQIQSESEVEEIGSTSSALVSGQKNVYLTNKRGERIKARLALPSGTTKRRAVVLLHGSGGMFKMPSSSDKDAGRTCSDTMESQFNRWAARLTSAGYVVIIPDSFGSRGYCDWYKDSRRTKVVKSISADSNGKTRRMLDRVYDLDAAARYLCSHSRVDCKKIAMVGFSNGGSGVMLGLHHKLNTALASFASSDRGKALGVKIPQLTSHFPFRFGVAYYPGCGFDKVTTTSTSSSNRSKFFYPRAPLRILIGSKDSLIDNCTGPRQKQADGYADYYGLPDRYSIKVFSGVEHGFDNAGCEKSSANMSDPDVAACDFSRKETMSRIGKM